MKWFMAGVVMGLMVLGMVAHLCDRYGEAQWYMLLACAVGALGGLVCRRDGEGSGTLKVERGTGGTGPQGHMSTGPHDERAGSFCCTPVTHPCGAPVDVARVEVSPEYAPEMQIRDGEHFWQQPRPVLELDRKGGAPGMPGRYAAGPRKPPPPSQPAPKNVTISEWSGQHSSDCACDACRPR